MDQNNIDKPQSATGAVVETISSRIAVLQQLVVTNYGTLTDAAFDSYPQLLFSDAERIVARLTNKLKRFGGPASAAPFLDWACRWIERETQRYRFVTRVLIEHTGTLRWAIREYLWTSATDAGVGVDDIFAEVLALCFEHAHSLRKQGKAKLSTRLISLARKHVELYHNRRNRRRLDLWRKYPGEVRCEFMTQVEDSSMKPSTIDDSEYSAWSKRAYAAP